MCETMDVSRVTTPEEHARAEHRAWELLERRMLNGGLCCADSDELDALIDALIAYEEAMG